MAVNRSPMGAHAGGPGLLKLLSGLLLPPVAWFLDLQTSYAIVKWACRHDRRAVLLLLPLATLALLGMAAWLSWSSWKALKQDARLDGGSIPDRSAFMALIGLMMTATFAVLVLDTFAARWILNPCD